MKKKWIALAICTILTASILTGCQKDKSINDNNLSSTEQPVNEDEDLIASGNGMGGIEIKPTYNDKGEITSFAYMDKDIAPDGTKIILEEDYKIKDCVKLPNLNSLTVVCYMDVVTDDDAEGYLRSEMDAKAITDKNAKAQRWDKVTIDYTTTYNGKTLDEKQTNLLLMIGSCRLPVEVENSIVGHKVGDEYKVNVDFLNTYEGNSYFKGKTITYTIHVKGIARTADPTSKEIKAMKASMQDDIGSSMLYNKYEAIAKHIEENAEFLAYPKKYLEEARIEYEFNYIGKFGTISAYAQQKGMTVSTIKKQEDEWIIPVVKRKLIIDAVASSLKVTKDSKEFKKKQKEAKYTDNENENLLYTALDKIIDNVKYIAQ